MTLSSSGIKLNLDKEIMATHKKGNSQSQSLTDLTSVSNAELFKRINALLGNTLDINNREKEKYPSDATLASYPTNQVENGDKTQKINVNENMLSPEGAIDNTAFLSNLQGLALLNQISALCHQNNDLFNALTMSEPYKHNEQAQSNNMNKCKNVPIENFFNKSHEDINENMKRLMNVCDKSSHPYGRPILGSSSIHAPNPVRELESLTNLGLTNNLMSKSMMSSSPIHNKQSSSINDYSNNYEKDDNSSFLSSGSFASDNDLCAMLNNLSLKSSSFSNWSSLSGASGDGSNYKNRSNNSDKYTGDNNMEFRYASNPVNKKLALLNSFFTSSINDPYSIERAAKLYRNAAAVCDATYTWSGQLPPRIYRNPIYSCKIFLGGVPWDITELGLINCFKLFGNVRIEWPGKDTCHPRYPPKGYVYILFDSDKSVKTLLQSCTHDFSNGGDWYFKISSKRMRCKEVQVIPWVISDSNFVKQPSQRLDPCKTVFVGALHGLLNAEGLAQIVNDLFGGVVYAGVDTDKYKYPIGSGRVTFNNHKSYMKAVSAAFVEIKTPKFVKRVQIDPYLEDAICSICSIQPGPYFCREMVCFKYFCKNCWYRLHTIEALRTHKPLMRNNKKEI